MSDISIGRYVHHAHEAEGGELRLAKGTTDKLVNKGTLLNKLATTLGIGDAESRSQRHQAALRGFRDALTEAYGTGIADEALRKAGLLDNDARLTGTLVLRAVDDAKSQAHEIRNNLRTAHDELLQFIPPDLSAEGETELRGRLHDALVLESEFGSKDVPPEKAGEVFKKVLDSVYHVMDGNYEEAKRLQGDVRRDLLDAFRSLAKPQSPEQLLERLATVEANLDKLLRLEGNENPSREERDARLQQALYTAMGEINRIDPLIGMMAQRKGLADNGALSALHAGAQELSHNGEHETALHTMKQCEMIVRALAHPKALTGSRAGDISLLRNDDRVPTALKEAGKEALAIEQIDEITLKDVSKISEDEARHALKQIRAHLSKPGRAQGALTLFSQTGTGPEPTLEHKSGLRLLNRARLDGSRATLDSLLWRARENDALQALNAYLNERQQGQEGEGDRIPSDKLFAILEHRTRIDLDRFPGIERGPQIGGGGFGHVFLLDVDGKEHVLKTFNTDTPLTLKREGSEQNEAIASYLSSEKHPNYLLDKVNISQPISYLVYTEKEGERSDYQVVTPHMMRRLAKQAVETDSTLKCHGLIMPKAKGKDGFDLLFDKKEPPTQGEKKQFIRGMLQSVKGLNERGFVHRDLKPENAYFDRESGITTLIDTGSLFKQSKNQEKHPDRNIQDLVGTHIYLHPSQANPKSHEPRGTEVDLYALGVTALVADHPVIATWTMIPAMKELNQDGITRERLSAILDKKIETESPDSRDLMKLQALRRDLDDPSSLAGFALECFDAALLPAEKWRDREWAQKTYSELLDHPNLQ